MNPVPPEIVTLKWCPVCGRDDRYTAFHSGGHYSLGKRCEGELVKVTYALVPVQERA